MRCIQLAVVLVLAVPAGDVAGGDDAGDDRDGPSDLGWKLCVFFPLTFALLVGLAFSMWVLILSIQDVGRRVRRSSRPIR